MTDNLLVCMYYAYVCLFIFCNLTFTDDPETASIPRSGDEDPTRTSNTEAPLELNKRKKKTQPSAAWTRLLCPVDLGQSGVVWLVWLVWLVWVVWLVWLTG